LTATPISCAQVNLSWTASTDSGSGVAGYKVYREGSFLKSVSATSASDTSVIGFTTYHYSVSAVDNAGNESTQSPTVTVLTPPCITISANLIGMVSAVGSAKDVVVDASAGLAYVASAEFGLSIVDVSTPSQPSVVGVASPSFYGEHVAFSGDLAVVSSGSLGFEIVDISRPRAPQVASSVSGSTLDAAISGHYAYVLQVVPGNPATTELRVFDLTTPEFPSLVGRVTVNSGTSSGLAVAGSYAYVASGTLFQTVDVSTPGSPRVLGSLTVSGSASCVTVSNGFAYVGTSTTLAFFNLQSPASPTPAGSYSTSANAVAVSGNVAYVISGSLLKTIDVTSKTSPMLLSSVTDYGALGIDIAGATAFLASNTVNPATNAGGLYLLNISNPGSPTLLTNIYGGYDDWDIASDGNLAVVTANGLGLRVVNVATPSAPFIVGALSGILRSVAMAGQYAYALQVVSGNPATINLVSISLSTPTQPSIVGQINVGSSASSVRIAGTTAYVAAGSAGLRIIDVSDPTSLQQIGSVPSLSGAAAVAVGDGYAYVGTSTAIVVVDVHTPSSPAVKGSLAAGSTALAVSGSTLYFISGAQFKTADVSNPNAPAVLSTQTSQGAQAIAVAGAAAVLVTPASSHFDTTGGAYVFDVSNAASPQLRTQIIVPGTTRSVTAAGSLVYTGDSASTVDIIRITQ